MAETDNKKQEKLKTSSIARKINGDFFLRAFVSILALDVVVIFVTVCFFFVHAHKHVPDYAFDKGGWVVLKDDVTSGFDIDDSTDDVVYKVEFFDGDTYVFSVKDYLNYVCPLIFALLIGEAVWFATGFFKTKQIRRRMRPLYDVALQAEAVSRMASREVADNFGKKSEEHGEISELSEGNMRHLESAINKADPNSPFIKTGDKELQGIEIALNNLLNDMQESKKQQVRFVSDASHELRTPIAVIQGYVNMLDRWGKEDDAILEESIEALKNESEHMKELVEQLLFLARGDSGRNNLQRRDFDLASVIFEVWEESIMIDESHRYTFYLEDELVTDLDEYRQGRDPDYGVSEENAHDDSVINWEDDDDEPEGRDAAGIDGKSSGYMINGDLAMIKQSARIFLQNAAKYSDDKSEIKLQVKTGNDGSIAYIIQDEGIGLTQDQLNHIFERFYRSDEARNADTGGTGLGLSIAKWIIDAHEARVDVLSRTGVGTRFTVSFKTVANEAA